MLNVAQKRWRGLKVETSGIGSEGLPPLAHYRENLSRLKSVVGGDSLASEVHPKLTIHYRVKNNF